VTASLFPSFGFDMIDSAVANAAVREWGHDLGECHRPFATQSFGLHREGQLVAVAMSASTVSATCGDWQRKECVELVRCIRHPEHPLVMRVAVLLWMVLAPVAWSNAYWPVRMCVSYSNTTRGHDGKLYQLAGWKKWGKCRGGVAGGNWTRGKTYDDKVLWYYEPEKEA